MVSDNFTAPYLDRRPQTPPSKAVRAARRKLKSPTSTSRFSTPDNPTTTSPNTKKVIQNNSLIVVIGTRSPSKMNLEADLIGGVMEDQTVANHSPAAAITPITTTSNASPARNPHIEDGVNVIDALTEALEELETALPIVVDDPKMVSFRAASASPQPKAIANTTKKRVASAPIKKQPAAVSRSALQQAKTFSVNKLAEAKSKPSRTSLPSSRTTEIKSKTTPAAIKPTARKPAPLRTSLPARKENKTLATPKTLPPRVATVAKAPFVPAKSTKTPTRPSFTLPGEAITLKKKAQLEARLKQEEEERKARREFKAHPMPSRMSIGTNESFKATIASSKRQSLVKDTQSKASKSGSNQTKSTTRITPHPLAKADPKPSTRTSVPATSTPPKSGTPSVAKHTIRTTSKTSSNATIKPARPSPRLSSTSAVAKGIAETSSNASIKSARPSPRLSLTPAASKVVGNTSSNAIVQSTRSSLRQSLSTVTTKGLARTKQTSSPSSPKEPTRLMTVQEKIDAAKKARTEAAERGRQASREWAEIQHKKRASLPAQTTKET